MLPGKRSTLNLVIEILTNVSASILIDFMNVLDYCFYSYTLVDIYIKLSCVPFGSH